MSSKKDRKLKREERKAAKKKLKELTGIGADPPEDGKEIEKRLEALPEGLEAREALLTLFTDTADESASTQMHILDQAKKKTKLNKAVLREIRREAEVKLQGQIIRAEGSPFDVSCYYAAERFYSEEKGKKLLGLFELLIPAVLQEYNAFFGTDKRLYIYDNGAYRNDGLEIVTPRLQNHPSLNWILNTAIYSELMNRLRRMTITPLHEIKAPEHLLCLENGILDLETGEVKPHSPEHRFVSKIPIKYDPEAKCPKIKRFITDVLGEQYLPTFYELAGHILSRRYYPHNAVMLLGAGRNGKGKLLTILRSWIGEDNSSGLTISDLNQRFRLASLFGKHLNVCGDLDSKIIRETGMFKQLTGQDLVTAEFKGVDAFQFENFATMIFAANQLPATVDRSDGYMRRWLILEFTRQFEGEADNPNIDREIIEDPQEFSGLLNEAIKGLKQLRENGKFTQTQSISATKERYLRLSEPLRTFKNEMLEEDPDSYETKHDLYVAYCKFCARLNIPVEADNIFYRKLYALLTTEGWIINPEARKTIDNKQVRCVIGLKIFQNVKGIENIPTIPTIPTFLVDEHIEAKKPNPTILTFSGPAELESIELTLTNPPNLTMSVLDEKSQDSQDSQDKTNTRDIFKQKNLVDLLKGLLKSGIDQNKRFWRLDELELNTAYEHGAAEIRAAMDAICGSGDAAERGADEWEVLL